MHSNREPQKHADIAQLVRHLRDEHRLPAVAGGLVTSNEIRTAAYGSRRLHGPLTVSTSDRFHLGSNGKAMTALLIARLVEERRLDWSTTLADMVGDTTHSVDQHWRDVTISDVLTHQGGLGENPSRAWWTRQGDASEVRRALAHATLANRPEHRRGSYRYSNLGYILAGHVAEQAAAVDYESVLLRSVLHPMGVHTAGFGAAGRQGAEDQPLGHETKWLLRRTAIEPGLKADNPPFFSPAGRVHMSVNDYATFVQEVLRMMRGEDRLVRASTMQQMIQLSSPTDIRDTSYVAAGWLSTERRWSNGTAFTHAGSNTLHYAIAWIAPQRDLGVFALANQGGTLVSIALDELIGKLLEYS